jgi:small subunit ribosomal protein S21
VRFPNRVSIGHATDFVVPEFAIPDAQLEIRNGIHVQVLVRDNNVDQALRALKKKMQREGIFREMKMRDYYEKPSQKRAREKAEAVRRVRKLARKRAQREGMVSGSRPAAAR